MRISFNKKSLESLAGTEKRLQYRDLGATDSVRGLLLEVMPSGAKFFRFRRKIRGKNHNIKIGRFPDLSIEKARKIARELSVSLAEGKDPNADKRQYRNALTLDDVFCIYVSEFEQDILRNKRRKSSLKGYETVYRLHVKPKLGSKKIPYLTKRVIKDFLNLILKSKGYSLHNHCLTLLKSMYSRAELDNSIFKDLTKVDESQFSRERTLSLPELEQFLFSLSQENQIYQDCVLMLCFTAQRKSAVLGMRWRDLDLNTCTWRIGADEAKNKRTSLVPLVPDAMEILKRRSREARVGEEFVFPSSSSASGHITSKSAKGGFWHRITSRIGMYCPDKPQQHLTIHDLRRTIATLQINSGGSIHTISKLLGHSNLSVTAQAYAHVDVSSVRSELERTVNLITSQQSNTSVMSNLEVAKSAIENLNQEEKAMLIASLLK